MSTELTTLALVHESLTAMLGLLRAFEARILAIEAAQEANVQSSIHSRRGSVLSAQSIRERCRTFVQNPLILPFEGEKQTVNGKSYGLSACTYDCRIAHPLLLPPMKAALATTMEHFWLPDDLCMSVLDKSSWARVFVSAFNTHGDPGWRGWLTVELVNLGTQAAQYYTGDPVCQVKFELLDHPTDTPYSGKYQDQPNIPVGPLYEADINLDDGDTHD